MSRRAGRLAGSDVGDALGLAAAVPVPVAMARAVPATTAPPVPSSARRLIVAGSVTSACAGDSDVGDSIEGKTASQGSGEGPVRSLPGTVARTLPNVGDRVSAHRQPVEWRAPPTR